MFIVGDAMNTLMKECFDECEAVVEAVGAAVWDESVVCGWFSVNVNFDPAVRSVFKEAVEEGEVGITFRGGGGGGGG